MVCHDDKEVTLRLTRNPMVGGGKLKLVLIDQMTNEQIMVVVRISGGSLLLIFCIHVRSGPIYWGAIYLA